MPPAAASGLVSLAFQTQQQCGFDNTMFGWWATGWAEAQHDYLKSLARRTTGLRWLSRLIKKQWEVSWDMWKHRLEYSHTPNSHYVALLHVTLNTEVQALYDSIGRFPPPRLRRFFRRPLALLQAEPLEFKQDWLQVVRTFMA